MSCEIDSGIDQCAYSVSGLRSLFICNSDMIADVRYDSFGRISGMTAANLFELRFTNQFADMREDTQDSFNGWLTVQTIDFSVAYYEQIKRNWLEELKGSRVKVIAETANGNIFLYGEKNGMRLRNIGSGIGTGGNSLNGYKWQLTGSELVEARELTIPIETIRSYSPTGGTIVTNCSAYSTTPWGSTSVNFYMIQNCLFSDFN